MADEKPAYIAADIYSVSKQFATGMNGFLVFKDASGNTLLTAAQGGFTGGKASLVDQQGKAAGAIQKKGFQFGNSATYQFFDGAGTQIGQVKINSGMMGMSENVTMQDTAGATVATASGNLAGFNFIRIRELLKRFDSEALRLLVVSTHYRKDFAYTEDLIKKAAARINYLYASFSIFYNMEEAHSNEKCAEVEQIVAELEGGFKEAMDDDFNTPLALTKLAAAIDGLRSYAERNQRISDKAKESAVKSVISNAATLGLLEKGRYKERLPEAASALIKERERLRAEKKFGEADAIRERLKSEHSISLEDSEYGTIWYKAK